MSDTAQQPRTDEPAEREGEAISLRLDDVTKVFDEGGEEVLAVEDLSMEIYDGEFVVFVGPSGCGKTTTLRMIAGLAKPTGGHVEIDGRDVTGLDPRERNVAMVFQNYALYPHKTVRENLAFPLQIRKYPDEEVDDRVREVAGLLDIPELLDRRPGDLSGGQQQRVALGRAIIRDPKLFLFDEPLSNLDAKLRIQMRTELNKLHDRVGRTSVYVTHDQEEAMTLGDRVAVMNAGQLQQLDPPQTVYEQPANRFVAGFIGEPPMNFFDAAIAEDEGEIRVVAEGFELRLPESHRAKLDSWDGDRERVTFGVRPENLADASLLDDEERAGVETFRARVQVVEPMGAHRDLTLVPEETSGEDREFTARVGKDSEATAGDVLTVAVAMDETHVFDGETGENLTA